MVTDAVVGEECLSRLDMRAETFEQLIPELDYLRRALRVGVYFRGVAVGNRRTAVRKWRSHAGGSARDDELLCVL